MQKKRRASSNYYGVSWHKKKGKWQALLNYKGSILWCGTHVQEIDAAIAINQKCDELAISRKNPGAERTIENPGNDDEEIPSLSADIDGNNHVPSPKGGSELTAKQNESDEQMARRLTLLHNRRSTRSRKTVHRWKPEASHTSEPKKILGNKKEEIKNSEYSSSSNEQIKEDEEMAKKLALLYRGRPTRNRTQINRWQPAAKQILKSRGILGSSNKKANKKRRNLTNPFPPRKRRKTSRKNLKMRDPNTNISYSYGPLQSSYMGLKKPFLILYRPVKYVFFDISFQRDKLEEYIICSDHNKKILEDEKGELLPWTHIELNRAYTKKSDGTGTWFLAKIISITLVDKVAYKYKHARYYSKKQHWKVTFEPDFLFERK